MVSQVTIFLLFILVLLTAYSSEAQQQTKVYRVGVLSSID
jgi:hypothetical protein